ncbi:MAG: hypothetical protein P8I77_06460 [Bacteroidia bacterium]|nr:hypothetical protein [Bacteroidia bacterium]
MSVPSIPGISYEDSSSFFILAGPCAIEGRDIALKTAETLKNISEELQIPLVFKGSYRKAISASADS